MPRRPQEISKWTSACMHTREFFPIAFAHRGSILGPASRGSWIARYSIGQWWLCWKGQSSKRENLDSKSMISFWWGIYKKRLWSSKLASFDLCFSTLNHQYCPFRNWDINRRRKQNVSACCLCESNDRNTSNEGSHIRRDCKSIPKGKQIHLLILARIPSNTWTSDSICSSWQSEIRTWLALVAEWSETPWNVPKVHISYMQGTFWIGLAVNQLYSSISFRMLSCFHALIPQSRNRGKLRLIEEWSLHNCLWLKDKPKRG